MSALHSPSHSLLPSLLFLLPLSLIALTLPSITSSQNLLLNGDLELGPPIVGATPDWTLSSNPPHQTTPFFNNEGLCYQSDWCLQIGSLLTDSSVMQQVPGIAVGQYNLSFYLLKNSTTTKGYTDFSASITFPSPLPPLTLLSLNSVARFDWRFYQFSFNVSTAQAYLTVHFTGRDDSGRAYYHVDDVVLAQVSHTPIVNPLGVGASSISGDPQFIGLKGQSYQVHGMDREVYNLISHPSLQLNSQFRFLSQGECPTVNVGQVSSLRRNCWSYPGSYMSSMGLMVKSPTQPTVQVRLISGSRHQGFTAVTVDNSPLRVQGVYEADEAGLTVTFAHSHIVIVQTVLFRFVFYNSDHFINQEATAMTSLDNVTMSGLLGSTAQGPYEDSELKWVEGQVDDYLIKGRELFGVEFMYNLYQLDTPYDVAAVAQIRAGNTEGEEEEGEI